MLKYTSALCLLACAPNLDASLPTYHKDVRPIVETHCSNECHHVSGVGIPAFDAKSTPALIELMLREIDAGNMPPWMPVEGLAIQGTRRISQPEIDLLRAWSANRLMGSESDYVAPDVKTSISLNRNYDLQVHMQQPYVPQQFTDEVRCFLIPAQPGWIEAYQPVLGSPALLHHFGADIIGPDDVARAQAKDAGSGWSCPTGVFPDVASLGALSGISLTLGEVMYHPGYGLYIPEGGALVLQAHYVPHVADLADQSGLNLWYSDKPLKQIKPFGILAPSILPCPTGISTDSNSPCSIEYAAAHDSLPNALKTNIDTLTNCGMTMSYYDMLPYTQDPIDHFPVVAGCTMPAPAGNLLAIAPHAHTRATWITVDLISAQGVIQLLNIPRWRWRWESTFWLEQPFKIPTGSSVRMTCELDNGDLMQWNAATNEPPSNDQPAPPPRLAPQLRMYGNDRKDEMCYLRLDIVQ